MLSKILFPRHYKTLKPAYIWKYFGFFIQVQVQGQESLKKKNTSFVRSLLVWAIIGSTPRAIPLPHSTPKPPPLDWVQALSRRFDFLLFFFPLAPRHPNPRCLVPVLPSRASCWIGFIYQSDTPSLVFRFPYINFTVAMNTNATVSKHQDIVPSGGDDSWRSKQFYSEKATSRKETKTLTYPSMVHC